MKTKNRGSQFGTYDWDNDCSHRISSGGTGTGEYAGSRDVGTRRKVYKSVREESGGGQRRTYRGSGKTTGVLSMRLTVMSQQCGIHSGARMDRKNAALDQLQSGSGDQDRKNRLSGKTGSKWCGKRCFKNIDVYYTTDPGADPPVIRDGKSRVF